MSLVGSGSTLLIFCCHIRHICHNCHSPLKLRLTIPQLISTIYPHKKNLSIRNAGTTPVNNGTHWDPQSPSLTNIPDSTAVYSRDDPVWGTGKPLWSSYSTVDN